MNNSELNKDFQDFLNSDKFSPSKELDDKILSFVKKDLEPSHFIVFSKLLSIQTFIGVITLLFCPQFNLSLTNKYDLFHYFHHTFGESICMMICGSIFIGSGAIFASYLLKSSEVRKIHKSNFLYYLSISIIATSVFMILGTNTYIKLISFWFIGATISGILMFEINRIIRQKLILG